MKEESAANNLEEDDEESAVEDDESIIESLAQQLKSCKTGGRRIVNRGA